MTLKWMESVQDWTSDVRDFTDLTGRRFADQTDALRDKGGQYISFIHVPTGAEVKFKAFLTTFTDTFNPKWSGTPGYGRMDNIQTYEGTTRTIQIAFDVPAASVKEATQNLQNASLFSQMMYPVFDTTGMGAQTIKSAPFIRMKFMNWAQNSVNSEGLLGTLSGFNFSPRMDVGVFQEGLNLYPKVFSISTTLTVVHENRLGWKKAIIDGNGQRAIVEAQGKTTFYQKQNSVLTPQNDSFPYGEKTQPRILSAADDRQITDGKINKELAKGNQDAITSARTTAQHARAAGGGRAGGSGAAFEVIDIK